MSAIEPVGAGRASKHESEVALPDNERGIKPVKRDSASYSDYYASALPNSRKTFRRLLAFVVIVLGGFFCWAFFAPIGGATIVNGRAVTDGHNLTINYRDGGTISSIKVRDGDYVEKGDILVEFDVSESSASYKIQTLRLNTADIRIKRLQAELENKNTFTVDEELVEAISNNDNLRATYESERQDLKLKFAERMSVEAIYKSRIKTAEQSLNDLRKVVDQRQSRISKLETEISVSNDLFDRGLTTRNRTFSLTRQLAIDQEQLETQIIQISERRSQLDQTKEDFVRWKSQRVSEIRSELRRLNSERAEASEKVRYLEGSLHRATIRAPESGYIVRTHINTIGSSVAPSSPLLELVPSDGPPVVEAVLSSRDVDSVEIGQLMEVRIPSQDRSRSMMFLEGEVEYISPDTVPYGNPPRDGYIIRGRIDDKSMKSYGKIRPGTVLTVYLVTQPKNFIEYVIDPYLAVRDKAFMH